MDASASMTFGDMYPYPFNLQHAITVSSDNIFLLEQLQQVGFLKVAVIVEIEGSKVRTAICRQPENRLAAVSSGVTVRGETVQ